MNMSLIEKINEIFKYMFSSVLTTSIFCGSCILLIVLLANMKFKVKYINVIAIGIYMGFMLGILFGYSDYVKLCFNAFVKMILNFIYFPSPFAYFIVFVIITFFMIKTLFSNNISSLKKIINYIFFSILYLFFMLFIVLTINSGVDIYDVVSLYKNDTVLAVVQISDLIFAIWIIISLFYKFYSYLEERINQ